MTETPIPTEIKLKQAERQLVVTFQTGETFVLPCEYLRVYSQSAEVTGHTPDQAVLQVGKQAVNIERISPVGNYAVRLHFDDGHDSGIYTWEWLYTLGKHQAQYWQDYLTRLAKAGHRHPDQPPTPLNEII